MPPTDLRADRDIRFPDGSGTLMLNRGDGELNNTVENFQQDFSSGSYFTTGEYIEIASISPTGSSRNYNISGKIMAQASQNAQVLDINVGIRFNSSGNFGYSILYNSSQMDTDWVEPVLWVNTTTDNIKLVIQAKTGNIHNLGVDLTLIQRGGYNDTTWNTTEVQTDTTTVPTGYTEHIGEKAIGSVANGAVELYHNNVKKLETTSAGATVTGTLTSGGVFSNGSISDSQSAKGVYIGLSGSGDAQVSLVGDNTDVSPQIDFSHDVNVDYDARLILEDNGNRLAIKSHNGSSAENMARFISDGAVELYHDNLKRFQTQGNGFGLHTTDVSIEITDQNSFAAIEVGGSAGALIDLKRPKTDDYDMRISIEDSDGGEGNIISDNLHLASKTGQEDYLTAAVNGAVELYYDGSERLTTASSGIVTTSPVLTNQFTTGDARALFTHTVVGNAPTNAQYVKIATLPTTSNSTLDHLTLEGQVGGWLYDTQGYFKISFSRRNSFSYFYDAYGDIQTIAAIQAYQQTDGTVQIWGKLNSLSYTKLSYSIPHSFQVTIEENPSLTETAPSGTLVFDSSSSTYAPRFQVDNAGNLSATTKSFDIAHPTKENMRLRYGSLEGPENGVYVRGRLTGSSVIELPEHWSGLVDEASITVQLTAIGKSQDLWVEEVSLQEVKICSRNVDCFYTVMAERIDVAKLEVEYAN